MTTLTPRKITTISEFHAFRGLPKPKHPLISVINFDDINYELRTGVESLLFDFYMIAIKRGMDHHYKYGQEKYAYDFDDGAMFFMAPHQLLTIGVDSNSKRPSGWMLLVHPDFLWNTPLAVSIKKYEFFSYSVNEALFLSEDEDIKMRQIVDGMQKEYLNNVDQFSQHIIVSQLETLLNYCDRFYHRQFITRQKVNHQILNRLENLLNNYMNNDNLATKGLPTVQWISDELHVSPGYLRSLLKMLTGQNTQQLIHQKLIDKAKEKLSTTNLSVSEIAYELGFEHPQSFSKLFREKAKLSPLEFRQSFN